MVGGGPVGCETVDPADGGGGGECDNQNIYYKQIELKFIFF